MAIGSLCNQSRPAPADVARPQGPALDGHYLVFRLGEREYGVNSLQVREVRCYEAPADAENAPPPLKHLVRPSGGSVPIVDLRLQFELERTDHGGLSVVIVLAIGKRVIGAVVDDVSDVVTLSREQLHPVPALSSPIASDQLLAIGTLDERRLFLVDIERLMASLNLGLV